MKKILSIRWITYHLQTLMQYLLLFHPFQIRKSTFPVKFRPGSPFGTFLVGLVSLCWVLIPVLIFVLTLINAHILLPPETFIVSVIGLVVSILWRKALDPQSYIVFDRHQMHHTTYGFYEKHSESFDMQDLKGLTLLNEKMERGSTNFKLCVVLNDDRMILLHLSIFGKKTRRLYREYAQLLGLKEIEKPPSGLPVNDLFVGRRSTSDD